MKFQLTITDATPEELEKILAMRHPSNTAVSADVDTAATITQPNSLFDNPDSVLKTSSMMSGAPAPEPAEDELDSNGYPHDKRIHAESRAKLAKTDAWKYKRGVDKSFVETVEAELRSQGYGQLTDVSLADEVAASAPAPVVKEAAAPPPPAPGLKGFNELLALVAEKRLDAVKLTGDVSVMYGVTALGELAQKDIAVIDSVYKYVEANIGKYTQ